MLRIFAAKKTLSLPAEFCRDKHDLILCRSRSVVSKRRGMAATEGAARWPEGRYDDGFWDIGRARGFLPARDPARALTAPQFAALQALLDATPGTRADGTPGLLATPGAIRGPVEALPNLLAEVQATQEPRELHLLYAPRRATRPAPRARRFPGRPQRCRVGRGSQLSTPPKRQPQGGGAAGHRGGEGGRPWGRVPSFQGPRRPPRPPQAPLTR